MSNILVNQLTGNTTDTTIEVFAGHAADSTTRTNLEQGLAKAWIAVSMAGTPSVQDSFNHSTYTDNGQGQGASNLTNSMRADTFTDGVLGGANVNGRIVGYDGTQSRSGTGAYAFRSYAVDGNVEDQRVKVSLHGDLA